MLDMPPFGTAQYAPSPRPTTPAPSADGAFPRALLMGIIGAAIGCAIYSGFVIITKFEIGIMSLAVGFIVAKLMMIGSKGIGGTQYQITAALLTYLAVSLSFIPLFLYLTNIPLSMAPMGKLIQLGLGAPFLELQNDPRNGIIGLVILFVGMRIAWRMTKGKA